MINAKPTQCITILGATGSIGDSTLSVIDANPHIRVFALTAHNNAKKLAQLCVKYQPQYAVLVNPEQAGALAAELKSAGCVTDVLTGAEALNQVASAPEVDTVMAAIVGFAGLASTLAAATAGKKILLANKEALVVAGDLFMRAVKKHQACLLPVDSEHNAIWQSLPTDYQIGTRSDDVEKIILTASGGPFLYKPLDEFPSITPEQAVAHPNWSMGAKISVDSATMMNKGLEFIEAHWLFAMPAADIDVVIHPQSLIHSMVRYKDQSVISQMGPSDMRVPIASVLGWPQRIDANVPTFDLLSQPSLTFAELDEKRFPCFKLAMQALAAGGGYPCVLNAANEVAVAAFLAGELAFTDIAQQVEQALENYSGSEVDSLSTLSELDAEIRQQARV